MTGVRLQSTDRLVERLAAGAAPVRRLRPPMRRAALWLGVVGLVGVAAVLLFADMGEFERRARHPELLVELAGTLGTGLLATIAAFHLSLPDRSRWWAAVPLPTLALWLGGSGFGCYRQWLARPGAGWAVGESADCLMFIAGFGLPLVAALVFVLRRARPLAPLPVALMAGLGAASLAAFLLQFFHPFDVTLMDLAFHALAVAVVVSVGGFSGARALDDGR